MKNIKWKRPHDTFFAGVILMPGEEGNFVTDEQLEEMRKNRMFKQCEILGHIIVEDTDTEPVLRDNGPTLKEWLAKGNSELSYPPSGFAPKGVEEYRAEQEAARIVNEKAEADKEAKAKKAAEDKAEEDRVAKEKAEADEKAKQEATQALVAPAVAPSTTEAPAPAVEAAKTAAKPETKTTPKKG